MRLDLQLAAERPVHVEGPIDLSGHEGVAAALSLEGPVEVAASIARTDKGDYRLEAKFRFRGSTTCSRCLRPIELAHQGEFALLLLPRREEPKEDEHALSPGELDVAWYDGTEVELGPLVAEQVVIAVPMKPLCREDCLGICPVCGANRNETSCDCAEDKSDPRWARLAELKRTLER